MISRLSITPNAFRAGTGPTAISAAKACRAKIRIDVSEASTVTLSFVRLGTGIGSNVLPAR